MKIDASGGGAYYRNPLKSVKSRGHSAVTYMDVLIPRAHDCMDAGGRAKQEARAEDVQERCKVAHLLWGESKPFVRWTNAVR